MFNPIIQDKMVQSKTQEKIKKGGWNPEEKKIIVFSVLVDKKSIEFSASATGVPRGMLQDYMKKVVKLNLPLRSLDLSFFTSGCNT